MNQPTTYAGYDSRTEFTQMLAAHQAQLFEAYMGGDWVNVHQVGYHLFVTVRRLLDNEERDSIEEAFQKVENGLLADNISDRALWKRGIDAVGQLYDALHAHRLLLPHYDYGGIEVEDDREAMRGAGLE